MLVGVNKIDLTGQHVVYSAADDITPLGVDLGLIRRGIARVEAEQSLVRDGGAIRR